ncbi:hypothetical protein DICPUDRAFT_82394 [Dictyostelium purpureum]|uniref:FNIP repeat-containing protein n=1 Tax=Dictyostelium purpureum TaxID=5786 RepID=F0ZWE1_DICPU|nr:uncharacterized protein DICPUDRAFT_82394 [Dictyostelium purpureum]XP_003292133.1 uncharacterized protein DICPUDRAFT_82769 [Dictyostelium purpureum]EGC31324.1 hypothetical protein DICPUDRAFT_82769 [Dictyostelium purpureum]EGC31734.1 hypothetical protein DICPUDRAFT_82394 [Dictyostelium purpureum]|eukprot:XP_003291741.1 hypothetical protein DICPUDRAFT_82394 [Dictyostelium purpureum]
MKTDKLFLLVWKNLYLRSLIFQKIKDHNEYIKSLRFRSAEFNHIQEIAVYPYRNYLKKVSIANKIQINVDLESIIPRNVESLTLHQRTIEFKIPHWIKSLTIPNPVTPMPIILSNISSLETLKISREKTVASKITGSIDNLKAGDLPNTLKKLEVGLNHFHIKDDLPNGLETLILGYCNGFRIGTLPSSLKELYINTTVTMVPVGYNTKYLSTPGSLPNSIHSLKIANYGQTNIIYPESLRNNY